MQEPAILSITNVEPSEATPGDRVTPEVTVRNQNTSGTNTGWIIIDSPAYSAPIMWDCFQIEAGQTLTRTSQCAAGVDSCLGSFEMPDRDLDLNISAGGHFGDTACENAPNYGDVTDHESVTVAKNNPIDPALVTIESCGVSNDYIDSSDDTTRFNARVSNGNGTPVDALVEFYIDGYKIAAIWEYLEGFGFVTDIQSQAFGYDQIQQTTGYGDVSVSATVSAVEPPGTVT